MNRGPRGGLSCTNSPKTSDTVTPVTAHMSTRSLLQTKLDLGLPVVVPKWKITGNWRRGLRQEYPWLNGGGSVRVYPDDTIEETDDEPNVM